jgi:hypothetical protein
MAAGTGKKERLHWCTRTWLEIDARPSCPPRPAQMSCWSSPPDRTVLPGIPPPSACGEVGAGDFAQCEATVVVHTASGTADTKARNHSNALPESRLCRC